jgi:DNA adenine methylase
MKVPQAFPYQGSKWNLAPAILRYFPDGIGTLIEPFAGSAAITLAAAAKRNHRTAFELRKTRITMPFRA